MERQTYRTIITNKSKKKREQLMGFLKTWVLRTLQLLHMRWFLLMSHCQNSVGIFHGFMSHITTISNPAAIFSIRHHRSRTLKDLNDVQLSKIIDSMEEVCKCELWVLEPFSRPTTVYVHFLITTSPICRIWVYMLYIFKSPVMMALFFCKSPLRWSTRTKMSSFEKEQKQTHSTSSSKER